ncbi:PEP-CTERM system histidine kinase PrsK [Massilia sp. YIM B02769]|uniref:XrtA/PEP-CTERM system histidine kinase PrsK n=1 Tax=Massilia sp. YIM B02769 TaxID=3050129 RepID=UPI0025B68B11|nr:XrtA/PEP-CTERM system histidine kinase PrsK [Massilia sp. YIM B02769]MDN4056974.1 PEP-CTERM system histidine kinase PrsK [Massilia sp. YIM B02769]
MDSVSLTRIAAFSYGFAAIGFVALAVPLLTGWRRRAYGPVLTLACVATALWAAALTAAASDRMLWTDLSDAMEVARNAAWSLFLVVLLGDYHQKGSRLPFGLRPSLFIAAVCYLLALGAAFAGYWDLALLDSVLPVTARVAQAVGGMLLVEQAYRNKTAQERWAIKFVCLAIGGMFAYDFYLYSHAMLFREVDPDIWAARGVVNALTVPLIAVSMRRAKSWSSPLAVSRRAMFHSAALFGSAIYLLAMGSAGYYLRYFGGSWGTVMQVTFLFGALLLAGILFSGTFRAWLKVFISKHFYSYGYDYREEWMRFTRTLSGGGENLGERAIQAVAALVESPGGVLWQRRESGNFEPLAHWQVPAVDTVEPGDSALCRFLESTQWVIDLGETITEPEKYDGLELPQWLKDYPRGWLVVPLMMGSQLFGFVVLQTARSPIKLNWEVIDLLDIAGSQAASYLAQQEAANALMVARQFESFNRMSTFVVHDLKNLVSQLSLMNANAEKHKDNPEFQADMLETVSLSVQKMRLMLQKLSRIDVQETPAPQALETVVRQAMAGKAAFEPRPQLQVREAGLRVLADRERLERVLGHLIQNAIEATPKTGSVTISLARAGESVQVEIADTGEGMSEDFIRERLFKPFESTKSAGMGIGVFESREYINELGGRLEVSSQPSLGTTFKVILPLYQRDALLERAA